MICILPSKIIKISSGSKVETYILLKNYYSYILLLFLAGCSPTITELADSDPEAVIARKDEILSGENIPKETIQAVVHAYTTLGLKSLNKSDYSIAELQFNEALKINQKDKQAQYGLAMIAGHRLFKKGSKTALWDALEQFGRAAYYIPTNGEPHYWMGRAYEKKDEGDFELIIETYQKALAGNLPIDLKTATKNRLTKAIKNQNTNKNFWK